MVYKQPKINNVMLRKQSKTASAGYTQGEKLGVSQWRNPKVATTMQESVYHIRSGLLLMGLLHWAPKTMTEHHMQVSGPLVAQEVERHRDTPKFCVRVIFDIYPKLTTLVCLFFHFRLWVEPKQSWDDSPIGQIGYINVVPACTSPGGVLEKPSFDTPLCTRNKLNQMLQQRPLPGE